MVWPATLSVGALIFAVPIWKPPVFTFAVLWQPEPLQSALPIGMWLAPGHPTIVIVLLGGGPANGPVPGPWQETHPVTPWCVPVTEYSAQLPAVVWHCEHSALVGMWFDGRGVVGSRKEVVLWHRLQSPVAGCRRSSFAEGRESPGVVSVLGCIPWKFPVSWQLAQVSADTAGWLMTPGFHVV